MTDPLSVSASVAGLLSLVVQVADGIYQYASSARNAPSVVAALLRELQALKTVLVKLDDFTHDSNNLLGAPNRDAAVVSLLDIESCTVQVESIQLGLKRRTRARRRMKVVQRLIWPFREDRTMEMVKTLHGYVDIFHVALSLDNTRQKNILQWLSPEPQTAVHQTISSQRCVDTGQWFLNDLARIEWPSRAGSARVLWCRGIPGAGKTILMSLVIYHGILVDPEFAIAYYYLNYKHESSQDAESIIFSLVSQLLTKIPALWPTVDRLYEECQAFQRKPSVEDATNLLISIANPSKVIIAIDALDEASNSTRDTVLTQLKKLYDKGFQIFLTSRPAINIGLLRSHATIIDITAEKQDLEVYASARLKANDNVQEILGDLASQVVTQIVNLIVSQAAGMFLLVVFQTDFVCNQTSVREMLEAAKKMPSDPDSVYSRTMDQINSQSPPQARLANRILTWLTFAAETLTPRELVEALAIEDHSREMDPLNKSSATMFARVYRGLVIVDESNDIIQLAHRTLQDYLTGLYAANAGSIHNNICSACLTYLSYDSFRSGPCVTPESLRHQRLEHAFQQYAAGHLGYHFFWSTGRKALLERLYQFITCKPLVQSYTQAQNNSSRLHSNPVPHFFADEGTTELHVAAAIEDSELLELVLTRSPQLMDEVDEAKRTALAVAVERGCEKAVRSLLGAGAKMQSESAETLLNCAARNHHDDIVELLICYRDLHDPRVSDSQPPQQERQLLIGTMKADHDAVAQALDLGTDPDTRDVDGGTALQWAAWYGYDQIVSILFRYGADVNAADGTSGRRALHEAAENGNCSIVNTLLSCGADVDAKDIWEWTPLHRAATHGGWEVVDTLLRHGADINLTTTDQRTALDLACERGQLETIQLLLRSLGGHLPADFDASRIEFWRVPMATKVEVCQILRQHLPWSLEAAYASRLAALNALTLRINEERFNSNPDRLYEQKPTISDIYGFPVQLGTERAMVMQAKARKIGPLCTIL